MRGVWLIGIAAAGLAGTSQADELKIEHAAARVVVIPEARRDVQVTVTPGSSRLSALEVRRQGSSVVVDGGLRNRIEGCDVRGVGLVRDTGSALNPDAQVSVNVRGVGRVSMAELPLITARVPRDAEVSGSGALYGSIGRTQSLDLAVASCGRWNVANTAGELEISLSGASDVFAGDSGSVEVALSGSGDVRLKRVADDLSASITGSGDVTADQVGGKVEAAIAGSGDVVVAGGRTGPVSASIAGSGDVRVDGDVESLEASIAGSGDVRVRSVRGEVDRRIVGSGDVIVGGQPLRNRR